MDFLFPLLLDSQGISPNYTKPLTLPVEERRLGVGLSFITPFLSLSHCLSLPSLLSLLPLYSFAFSMLLFVPVSIPLYFCLYISLSSCQTFLPANIKHSTLTMSVPPFPFPQPLVPQPPPASLCCIAHCLVREQGVMFMGRGGGSSRAWGDGGQGWGLRVGSVGKASTVPHLRSSHNDPPPCQGSCRR